MSRLPAHPVLFEVPARVLDAVDHERLRALIDVETQARCRAVVSEIDVPVHTVCYECRLAPGDSRVDVAVGLVAVQPAGAEDVLGRLGRRHLADPAWQRCLAFIAAWSTPSSRFAQSIPFVCVAFDQPGDPAVVPAPAISLCVDRDFFARQLGLPTPPPPPAAELVALAGTCHDHLRGEPLPASAGRLLAAALAVDGVMARHISLMVSRTPATFKLDVRMPVDRVATLLRAIGWPGDARRAEDGIRAVMPWHGHLQLNVVLHPALGAGLEVELLTGSGEAQREDRIALLDRLVAAGVCDVARAAALRDAWLDPVSTGRDGTTVARSWYIKVRLESDRIAEAKAYLGLMPRMLRRAPGTWGRGRE
jgi:hypothetical protein